MDHQISFAHSRREYVEVDRTVDEHGTLYITESCLVGLTEIGEPERCRPEGREEYDLHLFEDEQGARWHVGTLVTDQEMQVTKSVGAKEITQVPAREWFFGFSSQNNFSTRRELLAFLEDKEAQGYFWDQYWTRMQQATVAAAQAGYVKGEKFPQVLDREAYAAACKAAQVSPQQESEIERGRGMSGVYAIPEYSVDHMVWVNLARAHREWLKNHLAERGAARLREVTAAHPGDTYTRVEFEQACQTAGIDALEDWQVKKVLDPYTITGSENDSLVMGLATRRGRGIIAEAKAADQRCDECGSLIIGGGYSASLGLACGLDCFTAMSDRPGRYATGERA